MTYEVYCLNTRKKKEEDQEHMKERQFVRSSATCGGKRQWCLGSEEPIDPSHAWQNDVKASMDSSWQISPILPHAVCRSCRA